MYRSLITARGPQTEQVANARARSIADLAPPDGNRFRGVRPTPPCTLTSFQVCKLRRKEPRDSVPDLGTRRRGRCLHSVLPERVQWFLRRRRIARITRVLVARRPDTRKRHPSDVAISTGGGLGAARAVAAPDRDRLANRASGDLTQASKDHEDTPASGCDPAGRTALRGVSERPAIGLVRNAPDCTGCAGRRS